MNLIETLESTLLGADTPDDAVERLCADAIRYGFPLVMVNPCFVAACKERLVGFSVRVGTVIDFPFGASDAKAKASAAQLAIQDGADDVDIVAGTALIRRGDWKGYAGMIGVLREAAETATLKIILETALLSDDEIMKSVAICTIAGADFVKTSTGYASLGATAHNVELMRHATQETAAAYGTEPCGVKASGGIRTYRDAVAMIRAGASRIGTSRAAEIAEEYGADAAKTNSENAGV